MKRVALFGGSFNPIHIGHLALANYVCEWEYADEVWFLVSPMNPLKRGDDLLADVQRMELVELSIAGYPRFQASDFEFHLSKPSYTIHMLDKIKLAYPSVSFLLLIGADNWQILHRWKDSRRILGENELLIYPRYGHPVEKSALPQNVHLLPAPILEISSTEIRQAIKEGKEIPFYVHSEAYKKIQAENWYR